MQIRDLFVRGICLYSVLIAYDGEQLLYATYVRTYCVIEKVLPTDN